MTFLPKAVTATIVVFALTGCASTPTGPSTLSEITPIEQGDSTALKIAKLAKLERNIKDLKVPADFDTGGYSLTQGAVDVTTGALGLGVSNGFGFSGSLTELGLGLLMSNKNAPYPIFSFITFLPNGDTSEIYDFQKAMISSLGKVESVTPIRGGNVFNTIVENGSRLYGCKPSTVKPCRFSTMLNKETIVNTSELNSLGLGERIQQDSIIVGWSLPYDVVEAALIQGIPIKNTFLYVPHKNYDAQKASFTGEIEKMLIKVPYIIDLDNKEALFFVKK